MLANNNYARISLEVNLFFLRIMKEHALFLAVGFLPKENDYKNEALRFNEIFNQLLNSTTELSRGVVAINNDAVTDYTLDAENTVSKLTGVPIDTTLTKLELSLRNQNLNRINDTELNKDVRALNDRIISATKNFIRYKTKLLNDVIACNIMYHHYPTFIEHNRREAILYVEILNNLQNNKFDYYNELVQNEIFWNHIMEEHSEFVRGLLDQCEKDLIKLADEFAKKYEQLNSKVYGAVNNPSLVPAVTRESTNLTKQLKGFKTTAAEGLLNCEIKSLLNPLIADHVLREANHYLRLLETTRKR